MLYALGDAVANTLLFAYIFMCVIFPDRITMVFGRNDTNPDPEHAR
jgi:hypothetical protein